MEENENKKPEENEPEAPEGAEEKPVENGSEAPEKEKGGKLNALKGKAKVLKDKAKDKAKVVKQKTGEFMGVKRNRIIVLACSGAAIIALVVGLSVGLTQCHGGNGGDNTSSSSSSGESKGGEGGSSSAHTHEYGTAWKSDATQHWHECSCGDKKDAANHTFGSEMEIITPASETTAGKKAYKCSVCSYLKDEVAYTPYISEANFADAFKFEGDKITVHCDSVSDSASFQDTETKNGNIVHCVSTGDGAVEYYYTVEGEGSDAKYYVYSKDSSGAWVKNRDGDKYYDVYSKFDANVSAFDSMLTYQILNLDKEKGCYTARYTNPYGTEISAELYFNNGKIVKAIKSYDSVVRTYTFSEDASAIELPSNVHEHTLGTAGTLDLNSSNAAFEVTCTSCGQTQTKERLESDTILSILYGYYPQTHVGDTAITDKLDKLTPETNGWYKLDGEYYAKMTAANPYAVKFNDNTTVTSGTEYWFKCDPIEWKILSNENGTCSLLSSLLLDTHSFNTWWTGKNASTGRYACNYMYSELRSWLTGDFFNKAFANDSSRIEKVTVDNTVSTINNDNSVLACANTEDKIYLLSYKDLYGSESYFQSNAERAAVASDYVKACECIVSAADNCGQYWTRSPNGAQTNGDGALGVRTTGDLWMAMVSAKNAIRPAITVKLPVTSDHQHKNPTSGSLDLNNGGTKLHGKCPVCDAQLTCDYDSSKHTITGYLYGYYPQSHVKDSETIASLDALTSAGTATGWHKLDDTYYAKKTAAPFAGTYTFDDGDSIVSGKDYWFKVEPIEWKISSTADGKQTIYSDLLLDAQRWSSGGLKYATSEIRTWLNGTFHDAAFSSGDSYITATTVDNSVASTVDNPNVNASDNTVDKIYLFDVTTACKDMVAYTTDYARASGARIYSNNTSCFWTRTPSNGGAVYYIYSANRSGERSYSPQENGYCVRPVTTLDLSVVASASN